MLNGLRPTCTLLTPTIKSISNKNESWMSSWLTPQDTSTCTGTSITTWHRSLYPQSAINPKYTSLRWCLQSMDPRDQISPTALQCWKNATSWCHDVRQLNTDSRTQLGSMPMLYFEEGFGSVTKSVITSGYIAIGGMQSAHLVELLNCCCRDLCNRGS
jgi:hypothetical protein